MVALAVLGMAYGTASAAVAPSLCTLTDQQSAAKITFRERGVRLVVRIENPPRTRITLSIDNETGAHYELVWDPIVNDGLQHEVLLPHDPEGWTLTPSSEHERVVTEQNVFTYFVTFADAKPLGGQEIEFAGQNLVSQAGHDNPVQKLKSDLKLIAACRDAHTELPDMLLNKHKLAGVAKARGLLDQTIPGPVQSALSLLAEIAVDRARSGAMSLVRDKFVTPICDDLTFELFGIEAKASRVLPRTCTLAEHARLQDVLGSGRALLDAVETDIRETFVPALIASLPSLNDEMQTLAKLSLGFASRAIAGQTDGIAEIDYLVALLDQLSWGTGFDRDVKRVQDWVNAVGHADLRAYIVDAALPAKFDRPLEIERQPWGGLAECQPTNKHVTITKVVLYSNADRGKCVQSIAKKHLQGPTWVSNGIKQRLFTLDQLIVTARRSAKMSFSDWLQDFWRREATRLKAPDYVGVEIIPALSDSARAAVEASCAFRLVVGIAKWCSSQESCAAGEIAAILRKPTQVFAPSTKMPWAMCWKSTTEYRMPAQIDRYIDLGVRLVRFLDPPGKGEERQRVLAMVGWIFDAVAELGPDDREQLARVHDVIRHLIKKDYISALTDSVSLASQFRFEGKLPVPAQRAVQLIGAVASYARTYEDTKALDATAAHDARRQALESLIDAATDRHARGGNSVWSLGSNVGMSVTLTNTFNHEDEKADPPEIAVRVPLGIVAQHLPLGSDGPQEGWLPRYLGVHAGIQLFDLGQFARSTANDVTWASFVSPGAEVGFLIGAPDRAISITAHLSYAPAIADGIPPVWRYGVSLGYYVPFFDFN